MDRIFPLYSYDGELVAWVNTKRFRRLDEAGRIARVVKNRTGEVKRATLLRMPGEPRPSFLEDYRGTSYSFRQRLAEGNRAIACARVRRQAAGRRVLPRAGRGAADLPGGPAGLLGAGEDRGVIGPECLNDNVETWDYDYGTCSQTGYGRCWRAVQMPRLRRDGRCR